MVAEASASGSPPMFLFGSYWPSFRYLWFKGFDAQTVCAQKNVALLVLLILFFLFVNYGDR